MVTFIHAAGGLVQNDFEEYLLIFRNGRWDLPKGKREEGEELSATALREVMEECGLTSVALGPYVAATRHSYWTGNLLVFKQTHWYRMYVNGKPIPLPQKEEGIEQCVWCTREEAMRLLTQSYPSIRWIFGRI